MLHLAAFTDIWGVLFFTKHSDVHNLCMLLFICGSKHMRAVRLKNEMQYFIEKCILSMFIDLKQPYFVNLFHK